MFPSLQSFSALRPLRAVILTFLFFVCIGTAASADKATTSSPTPVAPTYQPSYFFSIDLDSRYQFVGKGALTEEAAVGANCYRFTYQPDGKLFRIEYRRAGVPMPDPQFGAARIDFEYQTGIERRWYRDAQGQPMANFDGIYGEELSLNAAGYPTDLANLSESGGRAHDSSGVIHYIRTLDEQNRLIVGKRIGLFGTAITDNRGFFETHTVYDEQGRVIERGNYDSSGNLLNNKDGIALIRTTYTLYPDATQITESYFDASVLATVEKSSGAHQFQSTVDQRGFTVSEAYFDVSGAPMLANDTGIHERRYTYDDRGNQLTEEFFDSDSKPRDQPRLGFARKVYKYDDKNRVVEIAFFGDDGKPQIPLRIGAAVIRQEYDDQGNIVRLQFFDGLGNPSANPQYGAPAIRIKVDGETTLITLRDAKDRPMKNPVHGYYAFSYKNGDKPLSPTNTYYDRHGRELSYFPRISVINPHLHALRDNHIMQNSARYGAGAAGLGALLACFLALRKSFHTKRRKVYVPKPLERFLGWFSIFAILEGTLRFFMTVYWAEVGYLNGRMGYGVYVLETIFIVFFLYRLYRLCVTMRVLNIGRDDIHRLVRDYFDQAKLKSEWDEKRRVYTTPSLDVRLNYFQQKYHAYLAIHSRQHEGRDLARGLVQYIRAKVGGIQAPVRRLVIALYYPSVAFCYLLLSGTAFYTLWQLLKGS